MYDGLRVARRVARRPSRQSRERLQVRQRWHGGAWPRSLPCRSITGGSKFAAGSSTWRDIEVKGAPAVTGCCGAKGLEEQQLEAKTK